MKSFLNHQHDKRAVFGSKMRYLCVYALTVVINLHVVDAMLSSMAKLAVILKLEVVNTQVIVPSTTVKNHMLMAIS